MYSRELHLFICNVAKMFILETTKRLGLYKFISNWLSNF